MLRFTLDDVVLKQRIDLDAPTTPARMPDGAAREQVRASFTAKFWSQRISDRIDGTLLITNHRIAFLSPDPLQYFLSVPWDHVGALAAGRVMWLFPALIVGCGEVQLRFVLLRSARSVLTAAVTARAEYAVSER
jgi:hypothetical protein